MNVKDKKIVIVGGSSGIGFAIAKAALEANAKVVIVSRNIDKLHQAKKRLNDQVEIYAADMRDFLQVEKLFEKIGHFDHLQITASEISFGDFESLSIGDAKSAFENKFWGPYQTPGFN